MVHGDLGDVTRYFQVQRDAAARLCRRRRVPVVHVDSGDALRRGVLVGGVRRDVARVDGEL